MRLVLVILCLFAFVVKKAQNLPVYLKQFENNILLSKSDTNSIDISGKWLGEEIQYDPTQSYIKVKFSVEFELKLFLHCNRRGTEYPGHPLFRINLEVVMAI